MSTGLGAEAHLKENSTNKWLPKRQKGNLKNQTIALIVLQNFGALESTINQVQKRRYGMGVTAGSPAQKHLQWQYWWNGGFNAPKRKEKLQSHCMRAISEMETWEIIVYSIKGLATMRPFRTHRKYK